MNLNHFYHYYKSKSGGVSNLLKATEDFDSSIDWNKLPSTDAPTVSGGITDPNGGGDAQRINFTDNRQARVQQRVSLSASTQYTFSVYARVNTGTQQFRLRNVTLAEAEAKTATTSWTRFEYTFTTTTGGNYDLSIQNSSNDARTVEFWGAMLNVGASANDYVKVDPSISGSTPTPAYSGFGDTYGDVTAYYSLRKFTEAETLNAIRVRRSSDDTEQDIGFDANGDLDTTALTTFVGSENLFFPSETFTGWGNIGGSTITSNTTDTNDPFGGSNATKVVAGSSVLIYKGAFTNVVRTQTFYAKAGTCETFGMYFGSGFSANFNISESSPSVTSTNNTSATITAVGNGWYRCTATLTSLPASDYYAGINFSPSSGSTFYIFGAQLEGGTTATTYNPTTTGIGGDGAVTKWYDQSGNNNDATIATASEQPLVVSGGALVEENGKAAIDFDGVDDYFTGGAKTTMDNTAIFAVIKSDSNTQDAVFIQNSVDGSNFVALGLGGLGTSNAIGSRLRVGGSTVDSVGDSTFTATDQTLVSYLADNTAGQMFVDGTEETDAVDSRSAGTATTIGARGDGNNPFNGAMQEVIFFDSDQSGNLGTVTTGGGTLIQGNINTYFDIV